MGPAMVFVLWEPGPLSNRTVSKGKTKQPPPKHKKEILQYNTVILNYDTILTINHENINIPQLSRALKQTCKLNPAKST